ncbi:ceramide kinase [Asparagus officinalis]|uniref:ceramide kinase n=1 Tax=Asparagus officinalis TaxID=4686 RepID=UPI00098E3352|nr:ceramide kinase [Asparagus officinalis]
METGTPALSGTLLLDRVGDVVVTLNSDGISWSAVDNVSGTSFCLGMTMNLKTEDEIKFSNIYAVEFIGWGLIYDFVWKGGLLLGKNSEMNRFVVHGFYKKKNYNSPWVLSSYIFGHEDFQTCKTWVDRLHARINMEVGRPKSLLVFVHPHCGKENGRKTWESVAPLFVRAKVKTVVSLTKRAGHAYDIVSSSTNRELNAVDGIVTVGGDGLFHEVLNGLLRSRHKDPYPPPPPEFNFPRNGVKHQDNNKNGSNCRASIDGPSDEVPESLFKSDDQEPLISTSELSGLSPSKAITESGSCDTDQDNEFSFPNDSTTGIRDSVTSALQIILGKKISLDIAQVVRWKHTTSSVDVPSVHYAASFAGYGFYGDVIKESEKYRWMGPKRYDFVGTKVFLEHRSYEAEVTFLEDKMIDPNPKPEKIQCGPQRSLSSRKNPEKVFCRVNCTVCNKTEISSVDDERGITNASIQSEDSRWVRTKGRFLSVGAAVISCRNEKAPDGLVADAHLGDGFLHLILVKDCSRSYYLWHLTQLTRRGGNPLNFKFVEHHKTRAFTFMANHDESSWNLDGELLQGCQVTVRACRGLVNLFASGPEV